MKKVVILSGKGGTGKTSLTASWAYLASQDPNIINPVFVDADVDAANLEFLLSSKLLKQEKYSGGKKAVIHPEYCIGCGKCQEVCRFEAIEKEYQYYRINDLDCEGCAACTYWCPTDAIEMQENISGEWYLSESRYGFFIHANLYPAQENSGKLVSKIKQEAEDVARSEFSSMIIIDGPPGIGCPVIASITGVNYAVIVAEPTISGIHDLEKILQTVEHFSVPAYVCINKSNMSIEGTARIEEICMVKGIPLIGKIPFDLQVPLALQEGYPVTEKYPDSDAGKAFRLAWEHLVNIIH
ncbi:MAG: ATP-binding protein [Anaerolineales bacterium]|nr:ATP-binding protein [Anaerolineales bacterium]